MRALRVLFLVGSVALLSACGTGRFVARGIDAYKLGDYENAVSQFAYIEREGIPLNDKGECRYLAYNGLALWHVGKKSNGVDYLMKARTACREPSWLPSEISAEMDGIFAQIRVH
jgi:hypothetical protein